MNWLSKTVDRKFSIEWILDKTWPLFWLIFGGSLSAAFSIITNWIVIKGPIVVWGISMAGAYAALLAYYLTIKVARAKIINDHAKASIKDSSANPLDSDFEKKIIKISSFYSHFNIPHERKRFKECQVMGPGDVILGGSYLDHGSFHECQIIILNAAPGIEIYNTTEFRDCTFTNCKFVGLTIIMTSENFLNLPKDAQNHLPIISGAIRKDR